MVVSQQNLVYPLQSNSHIHFFQTKIFFHFLVPSFTSTQILSAFNFSSKPTLFCEVYKRNLSWKWLLSLLSTQVSYLSSIMKFSYIQNASSQQYHMLLQGNYSAFIPLCIPPSFNDTWGILFDGDWITRSSRGLAELAGQKEGGSASWQKEQLVWRSWNQK